MASFDQQHEAEPPDRERGSLDEDDAALVDRSRRGDATAFDRLVRRHQHPVYGLVRRMVGEVETAEELTQDIFVRTWRALDSFRNEARFSTWVYRIAMNLCLDHLGSRRERNRRVEVWLDDPDWGRRIPASTEPGPQRRLEEKELAGAFQEALDELDPDHRAAFLLRHQESLSPAEIGEVLGISVANAKVRVHRAREAVLQAMRRKGHEV